MKLIIFFLNQIEIYLFNKTPLIIAIEKENIKIVKLLLSNDKIDINAPYILFVFFINIIQNNIFLLYSKFLILNDIYIYHIY